MYLITPLHTKPLFQIIQNNSFKKTHLLRKMSAFIQKMNPLTGQSDWIVQNEKYDYHQEVARAAFADMLHDTERNVMYEQALRVAIEHMHKSGKKANVLDIGTGTGLLSMMAVRHGADTVTACEAFEPMSRCALEVIKLNGCSDRIKVIPKRSTELKIGVDLASRANILVTEVFDTELIGEGALGTFKHAHDELLEKDCVVVPHSATIYAQVVESPLISNWNRLKCIYNDDGELLLKVPEEVKDCKGSISLHDIQLSQLPVNYVNCVTTPRPVFRFDWSGKTPFIYTRSNIDELEAESDGMAQAVFMWWDLNMDINNEIILSCAPFWAHPSKVNDKNKIPWRDHWMQAIYYFPKDIKVGRKEKIYLLSCHDEYSLWFNLRRDLKNFDYESPICHCGVHNAYARTRLGMLNDSKRVKKYLNVIENCANKNSTALILSNGFYPGLAIAKNVKLLYCYETNILSRRAIEEFTVANELNNVRIIDDPSGIDEKINLVVGEPYFTTSILPWDNLVFLHLLKKFQEKLSDDVEIFPKVCKIRAVTMEFDNLHKIRQPLGTCQDFKMEPFDKLISNSCDISDENVEAHPLWEYPGKALTEIKDIVDIALDVTKSDVIYERNGTFCINGSGKCNGIAIWVDWILDPKNANKYTVTTGPTQPFEVGQSITWDMHTRQGVCLLGHRELGNEICYKFCFNPLIGSISFQIK